MGESSPEMISTDYLDSSALVKRYLAETGSVWVQARCNNLAQVIVTADLARVEIAAAFARKLREGAVPRLNTSRCASSWCPTCQCGTRSSRFRLSEWTKRLN